MKSLLTLRKYIGSIVIRELAAHYITDAMEDVGNEDLAFNDLFAGKRRMVVPFVAEEMKELVGTLSEYGEVDLENGIFRQTVETKKGTKTRDMRLGKALTKFNREFGKKKSALAKQLSRKWADKVWFGRKTKDFYDVEGEFVANEPTLYGILSGESDDYHYMFLNKVGTNHEDSRIVSKDSDPEFIKSDPMFNDWKAADNLNDTVEEAVKFWNESGGGMSILISRAPIDVLRMSDFQHIQSCHSQGGSYFKCAVEEAAEGGGIAYLVKTQDIKNVDLEADEIFKDRERGVDGIEPLARIRLRRFDHKEEGYNLAVPEERVYGTDRSGFLESVVDWSYDSQIDRFTDEDEPESVNLPDMGEFTLVGGSYSDTSSGQLFNQLFDVEDYSGDVGKVNLEEQYAKEARGFEAQHADNSKHIYYNFNEDMDNGTGDIFLWFSGGMYVEIDAELKKSWSYKDSGELQSALNEVSGYRFVESVEVQSNNDTSTTLVRMEVNPDETGNPDLYNAFIEDLISLRDDNYDKMKMAVYKFLASKGYIESSHTTTIDDLELENFDSDSGTTWETTILKIPFTGQNIGNDDSFENGMKSELKKIASSMSNEESMFAGDIDITVYTKGTVKLFKWKLKFKFSPHKNMQGSLNFIQYLDNNLEELQGLAASVLDRIVS